MNHRERVFATLNHELPDRVPTRAISIDDPEPYLEFLGLQEIEDLWQFFGYDFRNVFPTVKDGDLDYNSEFPFGTGGGVNTTYSNNSDYRPFAKINNIRDVENYNWPDIDKWDFKSIDESLDKYQNKYAIILGGGWWPVFCQVMDFFGTEKALINLALKPKLIEAVIAHIENFYLNFYEKFFKYLDGRADIFSMGDDFATQRGMMISPSQWRDLFMPTYRKIFELAKSHGLYIWFHSCGAMSEVLPDLIDAGMDVWETVQVHLKGNDPRRLKKDFGDDITFFGAINTQHTLPFAKPETVRKEVRERIKILGKNGGYICGPDHHIKVDVPIKNTIALFDEVQRFRYDGCTLQS